MSRIEKQDKKINKDDTDLIDKLVGINRVAKVVKGGRRFGFAALVVVGDQRGNVGFGTGKAKEVPEAIKKATDDAKKNMVKVPLKEGRTLHHDMKGHFGAGKVVLRTAPSGTGKAKEVPEAIKKATDDAKKNMVKVPLKEGRTLHHDM